VTAHALPGTPLDSPLSSLLSLLNTQPNIPAPDDFYQELVDMHRDLSAEQSALVNAKLILLLANHVGDPAILREAMRAARQDIGPDQPDGTRG
jgi:GTP1/Obg family GTP-binding protein